MEVRLFVLEVRFLEGGSIIIVNSMKIKQYDIFLGNKIIGFTSFEKADAPMGVVYGKINFINIYSGYNFLKKYCIENNVELTSEYSSERLLSTATIKDLTIRDRNGFKIKSSGNQIDGMDSEGFEIILFGIEYPFFEQEFPHHVKAYKDLFK